MKPANGILTGARWSVAFGLGLTLLLAACNTAATSTPVPPTAAPTSAPAATTAPPAATTAPSPRPPQATATPAAGAAPTATPLPAASPTPVVSSRDSITLVTSNQPVALDVWDNRCSGNIDHFGCRELASDPLTWIDGETYEVVPLSGVERWEQTDANRWRFFLRDGVKFHNGEPWTAEAAKQGLDKHGDNTLGLGGYGFHGDITGEVVDGLTVDVVCGIDCPIMARNALVTTFQAPEWYAGASEEERSRTTVGFGPYKIMEWVNDVEVTYEAYADYKPNAAYDAQAPSVKNAKQVWRQEALVRSAMVNSGEADWADNIGFENQTRVPQAKLSFTNEIYLLEPDTVWHPELKKKEIRMALAHAVDCETLLESLYEGQHTCFAAMSQEGTLGVNEANSKPYEYDPERARQLLADGGYDPANEIRIYSRSGRVYRDVEMWEAVVSYWKEIGVNAVLQVMETSQHTAVRRSGCGQYDRSEGPVCHLKPPPPPFNASTHYYESPTSNEVLDYGRQAVQRLSCYHVNSRVCDPELEKLIEEAIATPEGDQRRERLENIAQIAHDEYYHLPFFHLKSVYGLSADLQWTPRYDPRIRVNTMSFR